MANKGKPTTAKGDVEGPIEGQDRNNAPDEGSVEEFVAQREADKPTVDDVQREGTADPSGQPLPTEQDATAPAYRPPQSNAHKGACERCGALVGDTALHTDWHNRLSDALFRFGLGAF